MSTEPVRTTTISAAVAAVLALAVAFGLDLTQEQTAAILGVVAVAGPIIAGLIARKKVTPNAKVVAVRPRPDASPVAGPGSPLPDGTPVDVDEAV